MIMELQERINVLIQSAELAQKRGALTLNDAYYAKQAVDALKSNTALKDAFEILIKIAEIGQKNGVYTLRDAYFIHLATENYESVINSPAPAPAETTTAPTGKKTTKKGE